MDRSTYIGGGDAGTILGLNGFQNLLTTWRKKTGIETDFLDNHHIRRGNAMEPIIERYCRDKFSGDINSEEMFRRYGTDESYLSYVHWNQTVPVEYKDLLVGRPQISVRHPELDYCAGHPDGLDPKTVWEFKAPAMRNFKYIERQGARDSWLIQVQYYMWITGLPQAKIAIWDYDEWTPLVIRIKPDKRIHKAFERVMPAFWFHVQTKTEPNYEGMPHISRIVDNEFLDLLLYEYDTVTSTRFDAEARQKHLKGLIMTHIGGELQDAGDSVSIETDNFTVKATLQQSYGTVFARVTVRPLDTEDAKEWRIELEREQFIELINSKADHLGFDPDKIATITE